MPAASRAAVHVPVRVPARVLGLAASLLAPLLVASTALAGGPRFVTGTQFSGTGPGNVIAFYTPNPLYFTDPGALSSNVSHAQADAMVAAAAAVWNVPTASITLAQGGQLAEHVSSANAYFSGSGIVFPADVQPSNYMAIPIAIVYDTDGSVTDLLLGSGASSPSGCRQNAVTESVDAFGASGTIEHAVIVLNGRCVGSNAQQLTQMQYQLMRAFGRVLGLAWSQLNDNVFTGATQPTAAQVANWPVMHPLDVICGTYTYQCMTNPFTLRPDDLSVLALLYPVTSANLTAGKTLSLANGLSAFGFVDFPTGQGMELVNVTVTEIPVETQINWQPWQTVSAVTGVQYQQNGGNPVSGPESADENVGTSFPIWESDFNLGLIPMIAPITGLLIQQESINPLYVGEYALGPYQRPPIAMSGTSQSQTSPFAAAGQPNPSYYITIPDAASTCSPGSDGSESAPTAADPSGWWSGQLCATGHTSWGSVTIKANRTWTLETTALDETGAASDYKAQPVLGVWNATDPTGTLPTVAAQAVAMNSMSLGMTQLPVPAASSDGTYRFVIADQFGAGRPDFTYRQRVLYADSLAPATAGAGGGQITITGMGFRQGNEVKVNGVPATVLSWTATQIVFDAPTFAAAGSPTAPVDVAVLDPGTGGQTIMQGALTYNASAIDQIKLVSAPASLFTGIPSSTPFAVRVFASDGLAPVPGASVHFAVVSGGVMLSCGGSCTLTTDATGLAQVILTGTAAGPVTVSATEVSGGASLQVTIQDTDPVYSVSLSSSGAYLAAGAGAQWSLTLTSLLNGAPTAGAPVTWTIQPLGAPGLTTTPSTGITAGSAATASTVIQATAVPAGVTDTVLACAWTTACAPWTLISVDPSQWTAILQSGGLQSLTQPASFSPVTVLITDGQGHPVQGATATVYQTVYAWEGTCSGPGPCPAAPVLQTSQTNAISDSNGLVSVTPDQVAGQPQVVAIAVATGTQGFTTTKLTLAP
jgi:hypothetical protein